MSTLIIKKLRDILLHATLWFFIFISLVALLDNKNTMIVTMYSESSQPLEAEFYFTTEGVAFSDQKMSRRYKIKYHDYYFRLPSIDAIQYARFDPTKYKNIITIEKIKIIQSKWFKKNYYSLDVSKSVIAQQIENYTINEKNITFKTTGKDAQLSLNFTRKLLYSSKNYHITTFLASLLLYTLLYYLYILQKTEEFTVDLYSKLIIYSIFLALSLFKIDYYKEHIHYNYTPDNIAHLSYIEHIHTHDEVLPKFENMYMITNKNAGNYLGHPPLYYYIMLLVYDDNMSTVGNVENFRSLNAVLFMFTILILLYMGFLTSMNLLSHFVYLTVITSLPMHAYLGSNVSNDNLAILGGIIFLFGLFRILNNNYSTKTYIIISLGIFISYFGKLTAGLLVFFAGIYFIIYTLKNKISFSISKKQILILAISIIPILSYQLHIILYYHSLVPTLNVTHPEEYKHSSYFIPEALRHYQNLLEWLHNYWDNFHAGWFSILSHHSLVKLSIFDYIGLFVLHIFALVALFLSCPKEKKAYCLVGKISLLAFISVALVQYTFSYMAHLHSGYTGGLQPRYLLPFMVSFAIMASIFIHRFRKIFLFNIVIILLCIQAIYSDFFYFLKYYI